MGRSRYLRCLHPAFQETLGRPTHPFSSLAQEAAASGSCCLGLFALLLPGAEIYFFKTSSRSTLRNLFCAPKDSSRRMFLWHLAGSLRRLSLPNPPPVLVAFPTFTSCLEGGTSGGPPGVAWRINSSRSECQGPLGTARDSRGRGLTAGPGNGDAQAASRALVASCPSASCSLADIGCRPLQELGGLAKESGLGLNSAQPFHVPLCTCVWLTHDNGRSCGLGPRGSSRAAA